MTDPYKPAAQRTRTEPDLVSTGEVRSELEQFLARLHDLGATPTEVEGVREHWNDLDPDDDPDPEAWTRARRTELVHADDQQLARMIADARAEYEQGTVTEEEAAERERAAALDAALAEAQGRIGGNVDSVRAWVGDDDARAEAVLRLELAPEGAARVTLWQPLADQLGWDESELDELLASYTGATEPPAGPEAATGTDGAAEGSEAQEGAQGPESEDTSAAAAEPEGG